MLRHLQSGQKVSYKAHLKQEYTYVRSSHAGPRVHGPAALRNWPGGQNVAAGRRDLWFHPAIESRSLGAEVVDSAIGETCPWNRDGLVVLDKLKGDVVAVLGLGKQPVSIVIEDEGGYELLLVPFLRDSVSER